MPKTRKQTARKRKAPTTTVTEHSGGEETINLLEQGSNQDIWITGDSIVRWAGVQYHTRNRLLEYSVEWDGHSGLCVEKLHANLQLGLLRGKNPKIILLHLGGNNIHNTNQGKIIRILKREANYLFLNFPEALIAYVFILPRLSWSRSDDTVSVRTMNQKRLRINRTMSNYFLAHSKGRVLNIKSIDAATTGFFRTDGVHLSLVGIEMYINAICESINSFLVNSTDKYIEK